ncbi:MAG: hypothetical protein WC545_00160 [Patescibacteria group bacterium]|jgi:hypothetical protein
MSEKIIIGFHQPKRGVGQTVDIDLEEIKVNGGGILNSQLKVSPRKEGCGSYFASYCEIKFNPRDRKRVKKVISNLISGKKPGANHAEKNKLPKPFMQRAAVN